MYLKEMILLEEVDDWIRNSKNEIYELIREARVEIFDYWKGVPYNDYVKLLAYKNQLDTIEYLLTKEMG